MDGQLMITLKDGQLSVQGPLHDTLLCYALLAGARDLVQVKAQEQARERMSTGLVVPMPGAGSPFGPRG